MRPIRGHLPVLASFHLVILIYILGATFAGGVLSVLAAALITYGVLANFVQRLVSFSAGALLGAAFIDLLPEAFESGLDARHLFATLRLRVAAVLPPARRRRHRPAGDPAPTPGRRRDDRDRAALQAPICARPAKLF